MEKKTYDEHALEPILGGVGLDGPEPPELLEQADGPYECPECGSTGDHYGNGATGIYFALCCAGCGTRWEPNTI